MEKHSTDSDSQGFKGCLYGVVLFVVFIVAIPALIVKLLGPFGAFDGAIMAIAYMGLIYYLGNRK